MAHSGNDGKCLLHWSYPQIWHMLLLLGDPGTRLLTPHPLPLTQPLTPPWSTFMPLNHNYSSLATSLMSLGKDGPSEFIHYTYISHGYVG